MRRLWAKIVAWRETEIGEVSGWPIYAGDLWVVAWGIFAIWVGWYTYGGWRGAAIGGLGYVVCIWLGTMFKF